MRRKKPENMTRKELLSEANRLNLEVKKNVRVPRLIEMITEARTKPVAEEVTDPTVNVIDNEEVGSVIDVEPEQSLAGKYELLCNAFVNDGKHFAGEEVTLSEEDAKAFLTAGVVAIV